MECEDPERKSVGTGNKYHAASRSRSDYYGMGSSWDASNFLEVKTQLPPSFQLDVLLFNNFDEIL